MIYIHCDVRERSLISAFEAILSEDKTPSVSLIKRNLPLGDIILSTNAESTDDNAVLLIIERKTVADFLSSIKDGRYQEQSCRLGALETCHNHNIVYFIEGHYHFANDTERTIFYSALFSVSYYKGFSIFYAPSISETARFIYTMSNKLMREWGKRQPFYSATPLSSLDAPAPDYCATIKTVKKDNITADNITRIMLMQIPGVSATVAGAICEIFPTLNALIDGLCKNPNCLDPLCVNGRKISKTVKAKLVEYFGTLPNKNDEKKEAPNDDDNDDEKIIPIEPTLPAKQKPRPRTSKKASVHVPKLLLQLPQVDQEHHADEKSAVKMND